MHSDFLRGHDDCLRPLGVRLDSQKNCVYVFTTGTAGVQGRPDAPSTVTIRQELDDPGLCPHSGVGRKYITATEIAPLGTARGGFAAGPIGATHVPAGGCSTWHYCKFIGDFVIFQPHSS